MLQRCRGLLLAALLIGGATVQARAAPAGNVDCTSSQGWVENLVCRTPNLARANAELGTAYTLTVDVYKGEYSHTPKWEKFEESHLENFEKDWVKALPLACGGHPPEGQEVIETCRQALGRAYAERHQLLGDDTLSAEHLEAYDYSTRGIAKLNLPDDWWGWPNAKSGRHGMIMQLQVGEDGHLYVTDAWGPSPSEFAIVDAVDGRVVASTRTDPAIWTGPREIAEMAFARLGLEDLNFDLPDGPIKIDQNGLNGCGRPNEYRLSSGSAAIYLFHWLPQKTTFAFNALCQDTWGLGRAARTIDYESLWPESYAPMRDGTFLAVVDYRWVIRFTPALTSRYFAGRDDLIRADAAKVDALVGKAVDLGTDAAYVAATAALRARLVTLERQQKSQKP